MPIKTKLNYLVAIIFLLLVCILGFSTLLAIKPVPASFVEVLAKADKVQLLDRDGDPLSVTYQNLWNVHDRVLLHEIPVLLRRVFVRSEDKRFYQHHGQDWLARLHAALQNIMHLRAVRGASTISEQVVRILRPRPRTVWSRWIEGWEAQQLERQNSKQQILQFYLNQVPFAANRRGIKQAATYYFDRDLDTLSNKEILALAVLVRAPSRMDIYRNAQLLNQSIIRLADTLLAEKLLTEHQYQHLKQDQFQLHKPTLAVNAAHFVRFVLAQPHAQKTRLLTTLDGGLQAELQGILDQRLIDLNKRQVVNAALLVADVESAEVLAWVVGGNNKDPQAAANIDSVRAYRQPGSALKPFLYALALAKGWTAATKINDAPLSESVAYGLHQYRNYSRGFYGPVSLREALGNSLNIPALKTIQFVGVENYLSLLKSLRFAGLNKHPNMYGDGLALGNAEVSLFELVQAYTVLAKRGVFKPLKVLKDVLPVAQKRILSAEISSLIGNILSDPNARRLEFGTGTILNLPIQTAVKTGTSSDFRDSWTMAYNNRYVVGVWMGNLDNRSTDGVTGSTGPGLVLRSVFSLLNRQQQTAPLYLSPLLVKKPICMEELSLQTENNLCRSYMLEYFVSGTEPKQQQLTAQNTAIRLRQPTQNLHLAVDPRVPITKQAFEFVLQGLDAYHQVDWIVDGQYLATGVGSRYLWFLQRGAHDVQAVVRYKHEIIYETPKVAYLVK